MNRPRHRQRSPLLWKMVGVAGAINLVLWPFLIHEGVFAGIRHEVLIPVTLIPSPPSHKLPDALRIVTRMPARPSPVPSRTHPVRQASESSAPHRVPSASLAPMAQKLTAARPVLKVTPQKLRVAAITPSTNAGPTVITFGDPLLVSASPLAPPVHPARHPAASRPIRPAQTKPARVAPPVRPAEPSVDRVRLALAARIARAKQLEAEGHQVAEMIAQQRVVREAVLPPPAAPPPAPAVVTQKEPAPVSERASPLRPKRPLSRYHDVPAVVVRRVNPTVPDALMKSTWHATFRGEFVVHRDGNATVRMVSSTGLPVLDRRAMEAAHRWRFQPARRDGATVPSIQPFAFEYDVHPTH